MIFPADLTRRNYVAIITLNARCHSDNQIKTNNVIKLYFHQDLENIFFTSIRQTMPIIGIFYIKYIIELFICPLPPHLSGFRSVQTHAGG
jgi:hypothetical protein